MKLVSYRPLEQGTSRDLFITALENAPGGQAGGGMNIQMIAARLRVLDAIEKGEADGVKLEDADWEILKQAIQGVQFNRASHRAMKDLIAVRDDVFNAVSP